MIKYVRVVLSAQVDAFTSGIRGALSSFGGFVSGIASGVSSITSFFGHIGAAITGFKSLIEMAANAMRSLWDTFVQGAINEERLGMTMKILSGSATISSQIMEELDRWIEKTGSDSDDAEAAIVDMAKALRATDGAVDPAKLFRTMDIIKRLSLATGMSMSEMSKIVGRALTGDVEMLARTLGISKEQLAKLSPEFAKFANSAQNAQETQLNEVMRLGANVETASGDALKALDEVATALGAGQGVISEYASSAGGEIATLQSTWQNFTEDVGKQLLPIIQQSLEKLLQFISDHREDIDKFVSAFGSFAQGAFQKLMDWIDSGSAEKLLNDLGNFSAKEWTEFAKAIEAIDWKSIAAAANTIANFINPQANKKPFDQMTEEEKRRAVVEKTAVGAGDAVSKALEAANTGGSLPEAAGQWMNQNLTQFPGFNQNTDIGKFLQDLLKPQKVEVVVTVDGAGNLKAAAKAAAEETTEDLVNAVTGGKKKKVGSN